MGVGSRQQTAEDRTRWADTQWAEAVICWTCENGKMRHMTVEFGLMDGWMDMFCALLGSQGSPKLLGGVGC